MITAMVKPCYALWLVGVMSLTAGLEWTEDSMPDGAKVQACLGEKVSFQWKFTTADNEIVVNTEWHKISGEGETILATHTDNHFFSSSETGLKLSFLPNAGIEVSNFTWDDFGMYRVKVKVEQNGVLISSSRTAVLSPPDVPILAGGNLVASVNPKPARDATTGSLHVQLQCGTFVNTGSRPVTVEWTTPSGQTVPSTSTSKGSFLLNLPNPVLGGRYTCRVQNPSVLSRCVKNTSRLKIGASVHVDETQARIQLLEAMASSLQDKNHELTSQLEKQTELCSDLVANANSEISSLQTQQSLQTAADNQLRSELQQQQKLNIDLKAQLDSLVAENDDVKAKLKSQEDAISAMKTEVDQSGANLQQQTTELLSNYRTLSQEFKDLKTETEAVKAKLKSQEDATSALKSEVDQSSTNLRQQSTELSNYRGLPDQLKSMQTKFEASQRSVLFIAYASGHPFPIPGFNKLVYDTVTPNIGNAYSNDTGVFTAPVSGDYVFSVSCVAHEGHEHVSVMVNGRYVGHCYSKAADDQGSVVASVRLTTGQKVWVHNSKSGRSVYGESWNTFTGFLVRADA